jgi:hypothetical protein
MRVLIALGALLTVGCGAQMVRSASNSNSRYAPVNEKERGGVIKYVSDAASFIVNRGRDDAYKQMYQSCNGAYRIVAEGQRAEGSVVFASGSTNAMVTGTTTGRTTAVGGQSTNEASAYSEETHYWYIQYACAAPTDSTRKP